MNAHSKRRYASAPARQLGQAFLLVVLLLVVGIGALIFSLASRGKVDSERDRITTEALAQAKQALIGRSVMNDDRPGVLLCPDFDDGTINPLNLPNDGVADLLTATGNCPSYLGRLPWKTLGLPDLRDGDGERLWYALSNNFRDDTGAMPINSDTKGNRTVFNGSTAVTLTTQAVAVIFAPGPLIQSGGLVQVRDTTSAACPNSPSPIARNLCAANYLESTGGANNAASGNAGPFISGPRSSTFNDRLLVITTAELMPPVEQRVARELIKILQRYKANTSCSNCKNYAGSGSVGCYPWADLMDGNSDAPPYDSPGQGRNRGRFPALNASPHNWGSSPCSGNLPTIPSWFLDNDWRTIVYYSAGRNYLGREDDSDYFCSTCVASTLTVDGVSKEVVIIMPGPLLGPAPRAPVPASDPTYWQYFFEDAANADLNDTYVTPTGTANSRDRIFTIP